jgi:DNA primase large subunit
MLSEREAAKYPFIKEGVRLVDELNLSLEELADPSYRRVIDRAAERVKEAIIAGVVSFNLADPLTELLSYPVAAMFVSQINENFLSRRYSLAEAVRVYNLLQDEHVNRVIQIGRDEFNWKIRREPESIDGVLHMYKIWFPDYLRASSGFHEAKWKLVNRKMENGYVSITDNEAARLLQVEVENWVRERVEKPSNFKLPDSLQDRLDEIKKVFDENRSKMDRGGFPSEVINEAFPPCMNYCLEGLLSGRRASHMERFGLTSFLVNVGMPIEELVKLYVSVTDFDESLTRYQIEHIAGLRGTRTKYTPPTCATLRTHGICRNMDGICKTIVHPLSYYRKKAREIQKQKQTESEESKNSNKTTEE